MAQINRIDLWGNGWKPRWYQQRFLSDFSKARKNRFMLIWSRRSGKDWTAWRCMIEAALRKKQNYTYYFPTGVLGRQVIFEGIDKDGRGYLSDIPKDLVRSVRQDDMTIFLQNGSTIRVQGTDNLAVAGPNPFGVVFSEHSQQNPLAWTYVRPILAANGGWSLFTTTPRGRNHTYKLWIDTENEPTWYRERLTIADTGHISMSSVLSDLRTGMSLSYILQEYFCSWDAGLEDAALVNEIMAVRKDGRMDKLARVPDFPLMAAWDIGQGDYAAAWVFQYADGQILIHGYYMDRQTLLTERLRAIDEKYDGISFYIMPWDVKHRDSDGTSLRDKLLSYGRECIVVPLTRRVADDLDVVREIFPKIHFDNVGCSEGLAYLEAYNTDTHGVRNTKAHARPPSAAYDALRTLCRAVKLGLISDKPRMMEDKKELTDNTWGGRIIQRDMPVTKARHHAIKRIGRYSK